MSRKEWMNENRDEWVSDWVSESWERRTDVVEAKAIDKRLYPDLWNRGTPAGVWRAGDQLSSLIDLSGRGRLIPVAIVWCFYLVVGSSRSSYPSLQRGVQAKTCWDIFSFPNPFLIFTCRAVNGWNRKKGFGRFQKLQHFCNDILSSGGRYLS